VLREPTNGSLHTVATKRTRRLTVQLAVSQVWTALGFRVHQQRVRLDATLDLELDDVCGSIHEVPVLRLAKGRGCDRLYGRMG
jgi:hypothetical protein